MDGVNRAWFLIVTQLCPIFPWYRFMLLTYMLAPQDIRLDNRVKVA